VLDEVAALHGLITIERDRGWFLEKGYLEPNKARALRDSINALCVQLRPHAVALVDGFGIPEVLLPEIARRALENK
jgi:acyl-CoA oxidase